MWIKTKKFILNALLPVYCCNCNKQGYLLCPKCLNNIPLKTYKPILNYNGCLNKIIIGLDYNNYIVKKCIHLAKYPPYASDIIQYITKPLINVLKLNPKRITYLIKNNFILVPIPLSKHKLAKRGFNQAELIAKELSKELNLPVHNVLKKIKNNKSQTGLNKKQRKENVKNVFSIKSNNIKFQNIILVDDIFTTGATIEQAGKTIYQVGAQKVWAIVLAKG